MTEDLKVSFQRTIAQLVDHYIGCRLLAQASPEQLYRLAQEIVAEDLYRFPSVVKEAAKLLRLTGDLDAFVVRHLEHLLWVEHRRALWHCSPTSTRSAFDLGLLIKGQEHLAATVGAPTVLITPMSLPYEDSLWLARNLFPDRNVIVYGEDIGSTASLFAGKDQASSCSFRLVGPSPTAVFDILNVLDGGGCFLTYPDFVYSGHNAQPIVLLGQKWPLSSGFISICGRPGTMLLPCYIEHSNCEITTHFMQAVQFTLDKGATRDMFWISQLVATIIASLLEQTILCNPTQWSLLTTVIAESEQRATV